MIALYSVNLRVWGKANLSLRVDTVFSIMRDIGGFSNAQATCGYRQLTFDRRFDLLVWYGNRAAIRATGFNPQMIRAQGVDTNLRSFSGCW